MAMMYGFLFDYTVAFFFLKSSVDEHLDCFTFFFAIKNEAAIDILNFFF